MLIGLIFCSSKRSTGVVIKSYPNLVVDNATEIYTLSLEDLVYIYLLFTKHLTNAVYKYTYNLYNEQLFVEEVKNVFVIEFLNFLSFYLWTLRFELWTLWYELLMTTNFSNSANIYCNVIHVIRVIRSAVLVVYELTSLRVNKLIAAINHS